MAGSATGKRKSNVTPPNANKAQESRLSPASPLADKLVKMEDGLEDRKAALERVPSPIKAGEGYTPGSPILFYDEKSIKTTALPLASSIPLPPSTAPTPRTSEILVRPRPTKRATKSPVKSFLLRAFLLYTLIAYFFVCPTDNAVSNGVVHREYTICRALDSAESTLVTVARRLEPHYLTHLHPIIKSNLEPLYATHLQPHLTNTILPLYRKSLPYARRATATVSPIVRRGTEVYWSLVHPRLVAGVRRSRELSKPYMRQLSTAYEKNIAPSVEWYSKSIAVQFDQYLQPTIDVLESTYAKSRSTIKNVFDSPFFSKTIPSLRHQFSHSFLPHIRSTYIAIQRTLQHTIRPKLIQATNYTVQVAHQLVRGVRVGIKIARERVGPGLREAWTLHAEPQIQTIFDKIKEYRSLKDVVEPADIVEEVREVIQDVVEDVKPVVEEVKEEIVEDVKPVVEVVEEVVEDVKPSIVDVIKEVVLGKVEVEAESVEAKEEPVEVAGGMSAPVVDAAEEEEDLDEFIADLLAEASVAGQEAEITLPVEPYDPVPTEEELAEQTLVKRIALEERQTFYEKGIAKLGFTQHDILVNRLLNIRQDVLANELNKSGGRFESLVESIDEEGDKMLGRLSKYFQRAANDPAKTTEDKDQESSFLSGKAVEKVRGKLLKESLEKVDAFKEELREREIVAVQESIDRVRSLVGKAQEELGFGWTWLDDVRHSDWQRFHKLAKADSSWTRSYLSVQTGEISDDMLDALTLTVTSELDRVRGELISTVDVFEQILEMIRVRGQADFKVAGPELVPGLLAVVEQIEAVAAAEVAEAAELDPNDEPTLQLLNDDPTVESPSITPTPQVVINDSDEPVEDFIEGEMESLEEDEVVVVEKVTEYVEVDDVPVVVFEEETTRTMSRQSEEL